MSSDQASLLLQLAFDARATEYFALASLTVVIFEWLISFRREVDLIWTRRKSLVKWLYVSRASYFPYPYRMASDMGTLCYAPALRLSSKPESVLCAGLDIVRSLLLHSITRINWASALAHLVSTYDEHHRIERSFSFFHRVRIAYAPRSCFIIQQVQGVTATIVFTTVDVILLLRIWILCERSRRALYVLMVLIIVEVIVMLCITALTVSNVAAFVHVGYVKGCYALVVPKYFAAFPVPSLILSCSMFCVTVRICHRRIAASRPYDTQSIIVVFLRDGLMWFLVVVLTNPPQIALWGWGRPSLIQVLMMPSFAAYSIIGARVLLNMMQITAEGATIEDEF
ncbi:hypothetical protein B0H19DRAFT_1255348 [Mycena capillaripes]|nr:hypothetical protein B0H19DRAFT_1255348 [Mycena capillaripes]